MISNNEITKILKEIAEYLEMKSIPFKPRAYEKAAEAISELEEEVTEVYKKGGLIALEKIPGVGISIAEKIEEFIKTGKLKYYEQLKKSVPVDLASFSGIEGLGPKTIFKLYKKLGIKNLKDLESAIAKRKIEKLKGFGKKSEEKISKGIEFAKKHSGRYVLGFIMPLIREIENRIKNISGVKQVVVAGSVRRMKETIRDADILVVSQKPKPVMDYFVSMPEVAYVIAHGKTKSSIKLKNGLDVDIRVVPEESFGAALNYFTGNRDHNVSLRELAIKNGWKLNEYGLFKGKKIIAGKSEEELYKKFGLTYVEPELRENTGELRLAKENKLPKLIGYKDLRGDLQIQTNWTDGANSIEEMACAAIAERLEYIVITDHTKRLAMTHGLDEKRIKEQWKEIDKVNAKLKKEKINFTILKGSECDILKDGSMDLSDKILEQLDVVGGAVHSSFNLSKEEQTKRIMKAMKNPHVDIIFHPTGRILNRREPYEIDIDEIIKVAKETGTVLEIDAYPERLDLKDHYIKKCVETGVKLSIDSDAHSITHLPYLEYGIGTARRGFATKNDIINAWPIDKMLSFLKDKRKIK
ncbi:DNA polymerase III [Candidatus Nomurabacteria bacterium RIFCSPHIGHO2_01_FULL_39_9]|uniref:DNA polymerase beta n=1 Tax=Candidatus Nomurabacteria bacterium RIFCSPHIGHO2_01_FULL_39_9 TaxID=1801735 RepID=A0A1F6UX38_9BACT|nr:MAG: DNA polymerase III [Candidatus Nomurabacteria bacterium RIFCSPHIGHO2_01_FULL_39_9]